ncbi:MAG: hypothetical protein L0Z62_17250, partial [Gemmataceae bacterium]|nr:hypothetical protein [Gemmataceae bacterium]
TADDQKGSSIAMDGAGNFVITWSSSGQDGSLWGVYAQRYNAAGVAQGSEFRVNTTTAGDQQDAAVAMDGAGNFVITWSSNGQDSSVWGVYAQQYNAAGVRIGGEFQVNTTTAGNQEYSSIAINDVGNAVVVWSGNGPGDSAGIFAQRYLVNSSNGLSNLNAEADPYGEFHHDHGGCGCSQCCSPDGTARRGHSGVRHAAEALDRVLDAFASTGSTGSTGAPDSEDSLQSAGGTASTEVQQLLEPLYRVRAEGTRALARRAAWSRAHDACFAYQDPLSQTDEACP